MTEEATQAEGTTEVTEEATTEESVRTYTQADMDKIADKIRNTEKAERAKLEKQLKQLQSKLQTKETEDEKAQREREEALEQQVSQAKEDAMKRGELTGLLKAHGIDADTAARLADFAGTDHASPEEGLEYIKSKLKLSFDDNKRVGGDGGRNLERDEPPEFSEEYVNEQVQKHGHMWLTAERRKKLQDWRAGKERYRRL